MGGRAWIKATRMNVGARPAMKALIASTKSTNAIHSLAKMGQPVTIMLGLTHAHAVQDSKALIASTILMTVPPILVEMEVFATIRLMMCSVPVRMELLVKCVK